jgi:hypothetical protein
MTREAILIARSLLSAAVAGGRRRAIFKLPLGHRRFFSKRSCLSSSKMRTGESCLIGLSFDAANPWPDGKQACVCGGERLDIGDTKANRIIQKI